jgi:hypothetical protein
MAEQQSSSAPFASTHARVHALCGPWSAPRAPAARARSQASVASPSFTWCGARPVHRQRARTHASAARLRDGARRRRSACRVRSRRLSPDRASLRCLRACLCRFKEEAGVRRRFVGAAAAGCAIAASGAISARADGVLNQRLQSRGATCGECGRLRQKCGRLRVVSTGCADALLPPAARRLHLHAFFGGVLLQTSADAKAAVLRTPRSTCCET